MKCTKCHKEFLEEDMPPKAIFKEVRKGSRNKSRRCYDCRNCNLALGNAGDSVETLANLITYLEDNQ